MSTATADWHVSIDGKQQGPYTAPQMKQMVSEGRMPSNAAVWTPGMDEWQHWRKVPELATAGVAGSNPLPMPGLAKATAQDYLVFRRMISPLLIQIVFWLVTAIWALTCLYMMFSALSYDTVTLKVGGFVVGLLALIIGPIAWRIVCELIIILFRISETLTDIKNLGLRR